MRLVARLWNSPTFTSWASIAAQSCRLLVVLPLLLRAYDSIQVAAWFLFSSITFLTSTLSAQIMLVFARMIALAYGGAKDLSPIKGTTEVRGTGQPEWGVLKRLFGTIGTMNAVFAALTIPVGVALAYFTLGGLVEGYERSSDIKGAAFVMITGESIRQLFDKYETAVRGLNRMALANRWSAIFALISAAAGAVAIALNATLTQLAIVFQVVMLLGVSRFVLALWHVEPTFRSFPLWAFDRSCLRFMWPPYWRSLVQSFASRGAMRIGTIVLARHVPSEAVASALLAVRLFEINAQVAQAPVSSQMPAFARFLSIGEIAELRKRAMQAIQRSQFLIVAGLIGITCVLPAGLERLETNIVLPNAPVLMSIGVGAVLMGTIRHALIITMAGNHVVASRRFAIAAVASIAASVILIPKFGVYGFSVAIFFPTIVIVNDFTIGTAADIVGMSKPKVALAMIAPVAVGIVVCLGWVSYCK